ncbi:MAG: DUF427 domain-containing protein [Candidatus Latescibacteria bacterium]|nr:DUF427 domain-containing protein [Candidatus Latescibacterota bacterium]
MKAIWNGALIAESDETIVVEGNHYFPAESIDTQYLAPSDTTSVCAWKGTANYHTLVVDGQTNPDAAWYYPDTKPEAGEIEGRVAFWRGVEIIPD